jgi:hypothetical protein
MAYIFLIHLTTLGSSGYIVSNRRMINGLLLGMDVTGRVHKPNLKYCVTFCLEGLRKTTKTLKHSTLSPDRLLSQKYF